MRRTQILILTACMIFGVGVLYSLYALSPFASSIRRQPFRRHFDTQAYLTAKAKVDLKVNSFYIAGTTRNTIYLGNFTGPMHLIQVTIPSLDTVHMNVSIDSITMPDDYRLFRMKVDSPYFYLSHGVRPGIFKGRLMDRKAEAFSADGCPYFVDAVPISPGRFALKTLDPKPQENELAIFTVDSPYFEFKPEILQKQVDGFFCVDGNLNFAKEHNELVYVYAYRNEYIVMDTSLNLLNRYHTIDTFSRANVKVANVQTKNYKTLASPPSRTNEKSWVYGNRLFIQSPLLSTFEDLIQFEKNCPIDVYDFERGKYLYTFYIPIVDGYLPSSVAITGNYLVAIYNHLLVLYNYYQPEQQPI